MCKRFYTNQYNKRLARWASRLLMRRRAQLAPTVLTQVIQDLRTAGDGGPYRFLNDSGPYRFLGGRAGGQAQQQGSRQTQTEKTVFHKNHSFFSILPPGFPENNHRPMTNRYSLVSPSRSPSHMNWR